MFPFATTAAAATAGFAGVCCRWPAAAACDDVTFVVVIAGALSQSEKGSSEGNVPLAGAAAGAGASTKNVNKHNISITRKWKILVHVYVM